MDASRIARKYNKKGSAVGDLMNPVRGIRDVQRRRGIEPRNHARENIRILREKQQENRERRQQKADAKPRKFKMKRFQDVKPRVAQNDSKKASEIAKETARMRTERKEQKAKLAEKNKRIREQRIAKARENTRHSPVKSSNNRETRKPAVPKRGEFPAWVLPRLRRPTCMQPRSLPVPPPQGLKNATDFELDYIPPGAKKERRRR